MLMILSPFCVLDGPGEPWYPISCLPFQIIQDPSEQTVTFLCILGLKLISSEAQQWCHLVLFIQLSKYISFLLSWKPSPQTWTSPSAPAVSPPHAWGGHFLRPEHSSPPFWPHRLPDSSPPVKRGWLDSPSSCVTCFPFICCPSTLCTSLPFITWHSHYSFPHLSPSLDHLGARYIVFIVKSWIPVPRKEETHGKDLLPEWTNGDV